MAINNNSAYAIVKAAYEQAIGDDGVEALDLTAFVDKGAAYSSISSNKEQFTKALIGQCVKNFFTDAKYAESYKDPFFMDERRFGNVLQMISAEAPEVKESSAWLDITSGTTTLGSYTIYLPVVTATYYSKTVSFELPIAITDEQWDDAFRNADELTDFVDYIMLVVDNAITQHREDMNSANRNNFMAEKIHYAGTQTAEGLHKINLVERYNAERNGSIASAAEFMATPECLRYGAKCISLFAKYLQKQSKLFNTTGAVKFVPKDRLVLQVLSYFDTAIEEVSLSTAYHDDVVSLPGYESVPYWQGFGDVAESGVADFDKVSKIDITLDSGELAQTGIVAFLCDKWAIMHTLRKQRVAVQRFDPNAITQYYYQFRDQYMNNLSLPAIVFTVEDPST